MNPTKTAARTANASLLTLLLVTFASIGAFGALGNSFRTVVAGNAVAVGSTAVGALQAPALSSVSMAASGETGESPGWIDGRNIECPQGWLGPCSTSDDLADGATSGFEATVSGWLSKITRAVAGVGIGGGALAGAAIFASAPIAIPSVLTATAIAAASYVGLGLFQKFLSHRAEKKTDSYRFVDDVEFRMAFLEPRLADSPLTRSLEIDSTAIKCSGDWVRCEYADTAPAPRKHSGFQETLRKIVGYPAILASTLLGSAGGGMTMVGAGVAAGAGLGVAGASAATGGILLALGPVALAAAAGVMWLGGTLIGDANEPTAAHAFVNDLNFRSTYLQEHDLL